MHVRLRRHECAHVPMCMYSIAHMYAGAAPLRSVSVTKVCCRGLLGVCLRGWASCACTPKPGSCAWCAQAACPSSLPADGNAVEVKLPVGWLLLGGLAYYLYSSMGGAGGQGVGAKHEISFQEFRNQLLAKVCAHMCVHVCLCCFTRGCLGPSIAFRVACIDPGLHSGCRLSGIGFMSMGAASSTQSFVPYPVPSVTHAPLLER